MAWSSSSQSLSLPHSIPFLGNADLDNGSANRQQSSDDFQASLISSTDDSGDNWMQESVFTNLLTEGNEAENILDNLVDLLDSRSSNEAASISSSRSLFNGEPASSIESTSKEPGLLAFISKPQHLANSIIPQLPINWDETEQQMEMEELSSQQFTPCSMYEDVSMPVEGADTQFVPFHRHTNRVSMTRDNVVLPHFLQPQGFLPESSTQYGNQSTCSYLYPTEQAVQPHHTYPVSSVPGQMIYTSAGTAQKPRRTDVLVPKFQEKPKGHKVRSNRYVSDKGRPNIPFFEIAAKAILSSESKQRSVGEIYDWVMKNYPHFTVRNGSSWRNSIRCNLAQKKCFKKHGRPGSSRGFYWSIDAKFIDAFTKGDFNVAGCRERRKNYEVRKQKVDRKLNFQPCAPYQCQALSGYIFESKEYSTVPLPSTTHPASNVGVELGPHLQTPSSATISTTPSQQHNNELMEDSMQLLQEMLFSPTSQSQDAPFTLL